MKELTKRILVAVPAAAAFLYVTWLGGWFFRAVVIMIGFLIVHESIRIFQRANLKPDLFFPYSFALWILLLPVIPYSIQLGLAIFLLFVVLQIVKSSEETIRLLGSTLFCGIYAPIGLLSFISVRFLADGEEGFMLALGLLLMVWGNDIFAYFGGKTLGKHRMAPAVSPNKTWEGFGFGFIGALSGFFIAYLLPMELPLTLLQAPLAIVLVSILGPVGDLSASKLKRASRIKDTSNILPGHGGFLDRFDALILAAPAFYLYLFFLQVFGYAKF